MLLNNIDHFYFCLTYDRMLTGARLSCCIVRGDNAIIRQRDSVHLSYCRIVVLSHCRIVGGENTIIRQTGSMAPLSHHIILQIYWMVALKIQMCVCVGGGGGISRKTSHKKTLLMSCINFMKSTPQSTGCFENYIWHLPTYTPNEHKIIRHLLKCDESHGSYSRKAASRSSGIVIICRCKWFWILYSESLTGVM